ncbi:MAG: DUF2933 domain-containing protein [Nocardioidaceae bacterium]
MNDNKYPLHAAAIFVGGAIAIWGGISPFFVIFLVACPLMMFFMMRGGMHDGHDQSDSSPRRQARFYHRLVRLTSMGLTNASTATDTRLSPTMTDTKRRLSSRAGVSVWSQKSPEQWK